MNTQELEAMVKAKFAMPQYATFFNVANGTGGNANRFADVVSMSVWPSRGLSLIGLELKVSRSDWQKELSKPDKAESFFGFCDYWWLVIGDDKIVQVGELPEPWGLMVAKGNGLKVVKEAPKLEPKPISRMFLAAIMRRAKEQEADKEALAAAFDSGRKRGEETEKSNQSWRLKDSEKLRNQLNEFEAASGIRIDTHTWNCGQIGAIVKGLMRHDVPAQMKKLAEDAARIAEFANESLHGLSGLADHLAGEVSCANQ